MKVLVAEDDAMTREILSSLLTKWGYQPVVTADGSSAMMVVRQADAPHIAILDWMMPGMDGIDVCKRIRERGSLMYIIMLTGKSEKVDLIAGLESGANDYVNKPFDKDELRVRLQVGARFVELQNTLAARVKELEAALQEVKDLRSKLDMPL